MLLFKRLSQNRDRHPDPPKHVRVFRVVREAVPVLSGVLDLSSMFRKLLK